MLSRNRLIFITIFLLCACAPAAPAKSTGLVFNEYRLVGAPDISTDQLKFQFAEGDQAEILARSEPHRDLHKQMTAYNNRLLASFGYRMEGSNIYHDNDLIAKDVLFMHPVSVNASRTDFISIVEMYDGTYMFTRDRFEKRPWPPGRESDSYVGDRMLSVEAEGSMSQDLTLNVYLNDQRVYQTQIIEGRPTYGPFDGPWSYNGHWALVALDGKTDKQGKLHTHDRVVQDGQDLNARLGYDQSFQFAVLKDKPLYFFQRNGKIGISFTGQEIDMEYDEVPHYNCCSGALLNPGSSMDMIWFFARRGKDWYYVEASVP